MYVGFHHLHRPGYLRRQKLLKYLPYTRKAMLDMSSIQLNVRTKELKALLLIGELTDIEIPGISMTGTSTIWKRRTFIIYE
jgi:hypothetical protein